MAGMRSVPKKDNTIKMNTGAGKTLVGLVCLQSSLNEGIRPAVYITPNKYLTLQVLKEAKELGIQVTDDEENYAFLAGNSILVANVSKVINGRSVFGVQDAGIKIPIGALIVDDAHACLGIITEKFTLSKDRDHELYDDLFQLFRSHLDNQSAFGVLDLEVGDPSALIPVPYWAWQDKQAEVAKILHKHRKDTDVLFSLPLIKDILPLCHCVFGGLKFEITPDNIPIDTIPSVVAAARRIFMTATLSDDSILVTHFSADPAQAQQVIRPKGGGDIGDRLILAPQEINPLITVDEVKSLAVSVAKSRNVGVIVPSKKAAEYWKDVAKEVVYAENIEPVVAKLRSGHLGICVFVNKYDGIDLPGTACELLILHGIPEVHGLRDRWEASLLDGTDKLLAQHIQRIEQGMGRGVRSNDDHCVVLLLGSKLTQRIHSPAATDMFSRATRAQLELGRQVTEQMKDAPLEDLMPVIGLCLEQDEEWIATSRDALVNAPETQNKPIDPAIPQLRKAFDLARNRQIPTALASAQSAVNASSDKRIKGYYKQKLAAFQNLENPVEAQETQLSALQLNSRLLKPEKGIKYSKLSPPASGQAASACQYMSRYLEGNDLVLAVNSILEDLIWDEDQTKDFESAIHQLGDLLGFGSQRPELEFGSGPDNLWSLGGLNYWVIECKSGAIKAPAISKTDTDQLAGSIHWFRLKYDATCTVFPIVFHPKSVFDKAASPGPSTRVIDTIGLKALKMKVKNFAISLSSEKKYLDRKLVAEHLDHFGLTPKKVLELAPVTTKKVK